MKSPYEATIDKLIIILNKAREQKIDTNNQWFKISNEITKITAELNLPEEQAMELSSNLERGFNHLLTGLNQLPDHE